MSECKDCHYYVPLCGEFDGNVVKVALCVLTNSILKPKGTEICENFSERDFNCVENNCKTCSNKLVTEPYEVYCLEMGELVDSREVGGCNWYEEYQSGLFRDERI